MLYEVGGFSFNITNTYFTLELICKTFPFEKLEYLVR